MSNVVAPRRGARSARVLVPLRHIDWRSRLVGVVSATVPPLGVTIWLAMLDGGTPPILVLAAVVVAAGVIGWWLIATSRLELASDGLRRWWLVVRNQRITRADVARVVIVTVFVRDSLTTMRRLFVVGHDGRTLMQMSGRWWSDEHIATVAHHFDTQPEAIREPLTVPELRRAGLVRLPWLERHPAVAAAALTVAVMVGSLGVTCVTAASV